jgi:hypothetical protein
MIRPTLKRIPLFIVVCVTIVYGGYSRLPMIQDLADDQAWDSQARHVASGRSTQIVRGEMGKWVFVGA